VVAVGLVVLGLLAAALRLDAPSDPTILRLGWSTWRAGGIVVDVSGTPGGQGLRAGDLVTAAHKAQAAARAADPDG
jgi:hypothetical protein